MKSLLSKIPAPFKRIIIQTSIRTRLLIAYMGIILVGFSGLTLIGGGQITAAVRNDYEQRLQNEVRLTAQALAPSVKAYQAGQMTKDALAALIKDYSLQAGGTLKLYSLSSGGTDGDGDRGPRDTFFNMPEMEAALRRGIVLVERNNESGQASLYTAAPVVADGNNPLALLQLSVPTSSLQATATQRWAALVLGFIFMTSVSLLAALWLSQSIIRPLSHLRESAVRLAGGDLSHRVKLRQKDEIGEVGRAFNEMADELQDMLETQRAFASNTSHEMRTPLTAIRLRTEALRFDPSLDSKTVRHYIEEIDDEANRLSNLVEDLTLLSRFDARRTELGRDEIDMARLSGSLCNQLAQQLEDKHIDLRISLPEDSIVVRASLSHLSVVFRNLLDNAIKYTPDGGKINWRITEAQRGVIHTIQDTGQGIDPKDLPRVYERFFRADKAHSRDIPGTGLGLALVKSVVDAYGGKITINSEGIGKGTIATVFWPYAAPT